MRTRCCSTASSSLSRRTTPSWRPCSDWMRRVISFPWREASTPSNPVQNGCGFPTAILARQPLYYAAGFRIAMISGGERGGS